MTVRFAYAAARANRATAPALLFLSLTRRRSRRRAKPPRLPSKQWQSTAASAAPLVREAIYRLRETSILLKLTILRIFSHAPLACRFCRKRLFETPACPAPPRSRDTWRENEDQFVPAIAVTPE